MLTERLKLQLVEKDKAAGGLQRQVAQLEQRLGDAGEEVRELSSSTAAAPGSDVDAMHEALRRIAAEVGFLWINGIHVTNFIFRNNENLI